MTAALRHLFPERTVDFDRAWNYFLPPGQAEPSNSWPGLRQALWRAYSDGYAMEITNDIVEPRFNIDTWSHAWWQCFPTDRYLRRLEGYLRGGWVAFTEIRFDGAGPMTPDGKLHSIDHIVLLDGVRSTWKDSPVMGGRFREEEIHVVCSVKGAYWISLMEFLHKHGGAGWWLCRRDEERVE